MKRKKIEDNYIFGLNFLYAFKFGFPFIGLILCGISLMFLPQAIRSPDNRGAGIVSTAIFIAIGMFFILFSKKFINMFATQYVLRENSASNHGKTTVFVSTYLPIYACLLSLEYNIRGGGVINLPVYLVSNAPIPYIPKFSTGALGLAKNAMELGIVVLPVNDKTTAWIHHTIKVEPPEYPKVGYFQNKAH